jgi:hypothetical protein
MAFGGFKSLGEVALTYRIRLYLLAIVQLADCVSAEPLGAAPGTARVD